jgi:virginiamycin B lyase
MLGAVVAVSASALALAPAAGATPRGLIAEYPDSSAPAGAETLTSGPDGNVWANADGYLLDIAPCEPVGSCTPNIVAYGANTISANGGIAVDSAGDVWTVGGIDDIDELAPCTPAATCTPTVRQFTTPTTGSDPEDIVAGPDGNLWFTESTNPGDIGVVVPCTPIATCTPTIRQR